MSGPYYAGVDLGGTKIMAIVVNVEGTIVGDQRQPTQASKGPDHVIETMVRATIAAAEEAGVALADLVATGISAPGPIDTAEGIVTDPPNLPGWHDVLLRAGRRIPHDLVAGDTNLGRFLQGGWGHEASAA